MRRNAIATASAVLVTGALLAGCANDDVEDPNRAAAPPPAGPETGAAPAAQSDEISPQVAAQIMQMRAATVQYVANPNTALDADYQQLTTMTPGVGTQYYNPTQQGGFNPTKPNLLVYAGSGTGQLAAVGWAFNQPPAEPPLAGATFGQFPAACHFDDGSFVAQPEQAACEEAEPPEDAEFTFWNPPLTTMYVWAWMANPDGVLSPTNSLLNPGGQGSATPKPSGTPSGTPSGAPSATPSGTPSAAPSATPSGSATPTESNED